MRQTLAPLAILACSAAFSASAATLDFTSNALTYTKTATTASGALGAATWGLSSVGGNLKIHTSTAGTVYPSGPLAFDWDGVGVGDDEVTNGTESLVLKFSQAIFLTGVHILDAFVNSTTNAFETAVVTRTSGGGLIVTVSATDQRDGTSSGYAFKAVDPKVAVSSITFVPGPGNDGAGGPDFALAAIDYVAGPDGQTPAPIPLPAGGALLLTAMGGLAAVRRRKSKA